MAAPTDSSSSQTDEESLLASLRAGDPAAYEQMVRANAGRMLAVARRFLGSDEEAHDVVQDAFLSAFRSLDRFEGNSQLSTWLHRIVVNTALMRIRSRARKPEEPIDDLLPHYDDDGHPVLPARHWDEADLERREARELVRKAIDELPEAYRSVVLLRDIEGYSTEETAQLLGVTANAAKVRLHRARQVLRSKLDPYFQEKTA